MTKAGSLSPSEQQTCRDDRIRAYKAMLKDAVEACPSGIRLRIAELIGKNKSFVSQVTNPKYLTPLPERYIEPILAAVHMTPPDGARFMALYRRAHPPGGCGPAPERIETAPARTMRIVTLELPRLASRKLEARVDEMLARMARDISDLAERR